MLFCISDNQCRLQTQDIELMSGFQKIQTDLTKKLQSCSQKPENPEQSIKNVIEMVEKQESSFIDLDLSDINIPKLTKQINDMLIKHRDLELIYLVNCSIKSLQGLSLPNLVAIDLSINQIGDDSSVQSLLNCSNVQQILMVSNQISNIQTVLKLIPLSKLSEIDLSDNPVCLYDSTNSQKKDKDKSEAAAQFMQIIFKKFPQIQYVNGRDANGQQIELQNAQKYEQQSDSYEQDFQNDDEEAEHQNEGENSQDNYDCEDEKDKDKKNKKKK